MTLPRQYSTIPLRASKPKGLRVLDVLYSSQQPSLSIIKQERAFCSHFRGWVGKQGDRHSDILLDVIHSFQGKGIKRCNCENTLGEILTVPEEEILPITVPNPAHAQFISRESTDPREETRALSAMRARQLIGLPGGESLIDYRDRAILKTFLWSGIRLGTACRLKVSDFHQDGDEATLRAALSEPGSPAAVASLGVGEGRARP
jgi:hypothetical protein